MPEGTFSVTLCPGPIVGGTTMAQRIRAMDWGRTALGPIDGWSETLLAQVNLMLASPYPTNVAWGEELLMLFNDASLETLGDRHAMALGCPMREVLDQVWASPLGADIEECFLRGTTARRKSVPLMHPGDAENKNHYWDYSVIPIYKAGCVAGVFNLFQDVTTSVVTKLRLVRERTDLDSLFLEAPAFIALYAGPEHIYKMVNHAYVEMLGERIYLERRVADVFPEAMEQGFVAKLDEVYRTGATFTASNTKFTLQSGPKAGRDVYVDVIYHARRDVDGIVCGIIEMGSDVTEKQQVLQALIETEKVAAVGRLASSIAHEINNPLASAVNYLYLAEMSETVDEVRKHLAVADLELKRVSAISNQTLLSQKHSATLSSISFETMVETILPLYQGPIWSAGITVTKEYRSREPVGCSEGEMRQVISNLVANAVDAMHGGGRLLIRVRATKEWAKGDCVHRLTVADTGVGIAPESLEDVFRAFFTTKGFAGNGLGLWVCREIVARHHGKLMVRSSQRAGRSGTVFALCLPRQDSGAVKGAIRP